jgi:hypothetical protein
MIKFDQTNVKAARARFAASKNELGFFGALKSEGGAIDLASIMVGVIVIGIIAGVIAATVFAVIPWAQDNAAKQSLDAVHQAESVSYAQSADKGGVSVYQSTQGTGNITTTDGEGATPGLLQASTKVAVVLTNGGAGYDSYSLSATGKVFESTSAAPTTVAEAAAADLTADGVTVSGGALVVAGL